MRSLWPTLANCLVRFIRTAAEIGLNLFVGGFNAMRLPAIVLACKSDLQKLISPNDALLIVQPYAGIIEVSSETDSGKSKMRRCVDVFVKLALKSRGEYCCIISRVIQ